MKPSFRKLADNPAQPAVEVRLTALTFAVVVVAAMICLTIFFHCAETTIVTSIALVGPRSCDVAQQSRLPWLSGAGN